MANFPARFARRMEVQAPDFFIATNGPFFNTQPISRVAEKFLIATNGPFLFETYSCTSTQGSTVGNRKSIVIPLGNTLGENRNTVSPAGPLDIPMSAFRDRKIKENQ